MAGTGVLYKDLVPLPEKTHAVNNPDLKEKAFALDEQPTASHELATAEHDEKGLAQEDHDLEVKDLGWNESKQHIPAPLVGGMDNEELWMLVRRFNKQIYHVKETTAPVAGNLDMNVADEDEFSPDKLRSVVERLYMTVIIGFITFGTHLVRLRSWRETRRTAYFAAAYFLAWLLDLLVPTATLVLITLVVYPSSRPVLFPAVPISLVGKKGRLQKPKAGVLGSIDSATGAPEDHKGEAVEAEAQNFVNGIGQIALSSVAGKHPMNEEGGEDGGQDAVPDPSAVATSASDARIAASGSEPSAHKDKTKVPMEVAMWNQMRPIMHIIADIADTWERFANALSPTPPFPQEAPRLRLGALVVPLFAISLFVTSYMFTKGVTFGIGFGFFGDPIISRALAWLNRTFPNWQKLLEVRNTILKGIPTNAQLTITLLRIGEANRAPLPPPPIARGAPPMKAAELEGTERENAVGDIPLGAGEAEIRDAASYDPTTEHQADGADIDSAKNKTHGKKGSTILGFFRGSVAASVETAIGADKVRAEAGSAAAKARLGVTSRENFTSISGPVDFKARYKGKKGHVYISTKATIPCVAFTTDHTVEKIGSQDREDLHPVWSVAIADIKEIKKIGGYGWKTKLVVGWSLNTTIADGLEITNRENQVWKVTAVPLRDELFNRLVANAGQKWESW